MVEYAEQSQSVLQLAERILALLGEAKRVATYKYALLLALIDECQRKGGGPSRGSITTRQLAHRVAEYYWGQVKTHPATGAPLRQITGNRRSIPRLISEFRERLGMRATSTPHRAEAADRRSYAELMNAIELVLVRWPIPLLQQVGSRPLDFLYRISWKPGAQPRGFAAYQRAFLQDSEVAVGSAFDNRLVMVSGVEAELSALAGVLRPVIQREWSRFVARENSGDIDDIEGFLFDQSRAQLQRLREPLARLQRGRCFYCGKELERAEVDHFIPWSRCADDGLANLVVADARCNGRKSDYLAGLEHLQHWTDRSRASGDALETIAATVVWPFSSGRSWELVRSVYGSLPPRVPLWIREREFDEAVPRALQGVLTGGV